MVRNMLVIGLPLLSSWALTKGHSKVYTMEQTMQAICCHWQTNLCRHWCARTDGGPVTEVGYNLLGRWAQAVGQDLQAQQVQRPTACLSLLLIHACQLSR